MQKAPPEDVLHGALTGGLMAIADSPISFEPKLLSYLPNAKVILTVRDPEKWYQSRVKNHAGDFMCARDLWDNVRPRRPSRTK